MQKIRLSFVLALVIFLFFSAFSYVGYQYDLLHIGSALRYVAGPFFAEKITPEQIFAEYETNKIKILIVPGHDNASFGTQFNGVKEAQMNADVGQKLFEFFQADDKFEVYLTRDKNGEYSQWFKEYLRSGKKEVAAFRDNSKRQALLAKMEGMPDSNNPVEHNSAADDVSLTLYAINKWANENNVEVVLHIHFNDYPRKNTSQAGKYTGFSIYVPEYQLPNYRASFELAKSLKNQMEKHFSPSNLPVESSVLIEDRELIAIGSNASRDGVSILTEYGYVYEPQFMNKGTREAAFREAAYQTYIGIKKFFDKNIRPVNNYETTLLPYKWENFLQKGMGGRKDIMSLQAALYQEGFYPPSSKNLEECPINGVFKECTYEAVKKFQEKYAEDILTTENTTEKPSGFVGQKTLIKLNEIYGE